MKNLLHFVSDCIQLPTTVQDQHYFLSSEFALCMLRNNLTDRGVAFHHFLRQKFGSECRLLVGLLNCLVASVLGNFVLVKVY